MLGSYYSRFSHILVLSKVTSIYDSSTVHSCCHYELPSLTNRTWHWLNCSQLTEMALCTVKTLINSCFGIVRIVCSIRTWKLFCHSRASWTVITWWTVTSGCWFTTRTVLSFRTNITLGCIKQVRTVWIGSRRTRILSWWSCACFKAEIVHQSKLWTVHKLCPIFCVKVFQPDSSTLGVNAENHRKCSHWSHFPKLNWTFGIVFQAKL